MSSQNYVKIFDTTLRDGEQSPGCSMNLDEKLRVAEQLEALGVDIIEAGFAIASEGDFEAVRRSRGSAKRATVASLARAAAATSSAPGRRVKARQARRASTPSSPPRRCT